MAHPVACQGGTSNFDPQIFLFWKPKFQIISWKQQLSSIKTMYIHSLEHFVSHLIQDQRHTECGFYRIINLSMENIMTSSLKLGCNR